MKHDIVILITICSLNNHFKKLINPYYKYVTEADKKKKKRVENNHDRSCLQSVQRKNRARKRTFGLLKPGDRKNACRMPTIVKHSLVKYRSSAETNQDQPE
jgi:hypothetical protein